MRVIPGRGCVWRVVGFALSILPDRPTVRNCGVSRSGLERPVVEGESPVDENIMTVVSGYPSSSGPVKSAVNLSGPPDKPEYSLVTDSGQVP